ncbi:MAG: methyl-accepting chemotaxis protein [Oscillospiraceae bacterium]
MKSIKAKILVNMIVTVAVSLIMLGAVCIFINYNSTQKLLGQTMTETASVTAERISKDLEIVMNIAKETGSIARLSAETSTVADKQTIIDQKVKTYGFARGNILDASGKSIFDGKDYSDRDYFKAAMKGDGYVSDPVLSKITGTYSLIIAAPLWDKGIPGTRVVGAVYFAPQPEFLIDIVSEIKVSPTGSCYIIDKNGFTIADPNIDAVNNRENIQEMAKTDSSLKVLSDIHDRMHAGETGFHKYIFGGVPKFSGFAPIPAAAGWSVAITAHTSDFMQSTYTGILITVALLVVSILMAVLLAFALANGIGKPITACKDRLLLLAEGNLTAPVPDIKAKDETGMLADATVTIVDALNGMIGDVGYLLGEMANGNFDIKSKNREVYVGDFSALLDSVREINSNLSDALTQINIASDQVSGGSDQVSAGAQALSQGATEQASSVEELAASITEISAQVRQNAESAKNASSLSIETSESVTIGNNKMQELIAAMGDISRSSQEIGKVIKTIEDIAFQTNILALNAAVEAARAGAAGKGFAVVADEVRNLASKSAEAAKGTTELIAGSVASVKRGTTLADDTAKALTAVVTDTTEVTRIINEISSASDEQATSIAQVTLGVDQISSVVQTNSATAEESAAASEELSGQAQMLKDLVAQFTVAGASEAKKPTEKAAVQKNEYSDFDMGSKY